MTALIRWWWRSYLLGWRTHPVVFVATDVVAAPLVVAGIVAALMGRLPWWPVLLLGIPAAAAAVLATPWLPFPRPVIGEPVNVQKGQVR